MTGAHLPNKTTKLVAENIASQGTSTHIINLVILEASQGISTNIINLVILEASQGISTHIIDSVILEAS